MLSNRIVKRVLLRSMSSTQYLGLVLALGILRRSEHVLCLLFGKKRSVCSLFLWFGRTILAKILENNSHASVKMPSEEELIQFQLAIGRKFSTLQNFYCVADGLKLYLEQSGHCVIQNMFYNWWTHDHYIGNVFVFSPNGFKLPAQSTHRVQCMVQS